MRFSFIFSCLLFLAFAPGLNAQDRGQFGAVIRIDENAFRADAGRIDFDEVSLSTVNPPYAPILYGAPRDAVTVTFAGFFRGQRLATSGQCPPGASRTGCLAGTPISPLQLEQASPRTFTVRDGANPNSPSLSGTPQFNGPISMLFDQDVAGVGLEGGHFNAVRSTAIQAFDRNGNLLGGVKNIGLGMEYMALVTDDGRNRIAGLQFSLVGAEPAGFGIDGLTFAMARQIDRGQVPALSDALNPPQDDGGLRSLFSAPETKEADEPNNNEETPKPRGGSSLSDLFD